LVTNRNFEHFWLNEGFTVFVERKILAKLYGEKARQFAAIGGLKDLKDAVSSVKYIMNFALELQ
jgi:leukotriene-A4 hydrolase